MDRSNNKHKGSLMFRKLVSNLSFSPALVGQLGFYAKRLRQEETTRRIGLIFTALALVVQSFAVLRPPESANAANGNDFVRGGVSSMSQFVSYYDSNHNHIKDFMNTVGVTRANLLNTTQTTLNSKSGVLSYGFEKHFSTGSGEHMYQFPLAGGGSDIVYYRPLSLWDTGSNVKTGSTYKAWVGTSSKGMWFAIIANCGNFATKSAPPVAPCPPGTIGTYPRCTSPPVAKPTPKPVAPPPAAPLPSPAPMPTPPPAATPIAQCGALSITPIGKLYSLNGSASASGGASIIRYKYQITRDGKNVFSESVASSSTSTSTAYSPPGPGTYTATLVVETSLGQKTDSECSKTFTVAPPEVCALNPSLQKDSPECQPCPAERTIWIKDSRCSAKTIETKKATNITQGNVDASTVIAQASDRIVYTISIENNGLADATMTMEETLTDVLEYASILDNGGGTYNDANKTLTWSNVTIKPQSKQSRNFVVQLASNISTFPRGYSNKTSYDCIMTNTFGNSVSINVNCPAPKQIEQITSELPHTGVTENLIFAGTVASIVIYFYARSRQLKTEVRLIRRDFNAGTI